MTNEEFINKMRELAFGTKDPSFYSLKEIFDELLNRSNEHYHLKETQDESNY